MKSIARFIKDARVDNYLTQKQFAEKFYITEKAVSNYENGIRTPDLDFLINLCREFNLSLNALIEPQKEKSNFKDLIISERNGKKAILDRRQDVCLTPYCYDEIHLSKSGYHIAKKRKKNIGLDIDGISFIIDNWGNKIGFKDFLVDISKGEKLELCGHCSFETGVCPALNINDGLEYLIDINGNQVSKGYKRILPAVDVSYGLFTAPKEDDFKDRVLISCTGEELSEELKLTPSFLYREKKREKQIPNKKLENVDEIIEIINNYGLDGELVEKIPAKIYDDNIEKFNDANEKFKKHYNEKIYEMEGFRMFYIPEVDTLDKALNMIEKYGFDIINFIPQCIFSEKSDYLQIIFAILRYSRNIITQNQEIAVDALLRTMMTLTKFAQMWGVKGEISSDEKKELHDYEDYIENMIRIPKERIRLIETIKSTLKETGLN